MNIISLLKSKFNYFLASLFFIVFFVVGFLSLPNYGQNWDEATHFSRGQSFLHFFLTGKKSFSDLPPDYRKSYFQSDNVNNFNYYVRPDRAAHPSVSDILAAFSNYVFYHKLNIVGDYESYHLYSVFLSSILVGIVVYFTSIYFGRFSGSIAGLSLLLYPFFLSESRFNTKDFPETFFYSLFILMFWLAVKKRKIILIFISSIVFGLALATKFNIFFAAFTVCIWFLIYSISIIRNKGVLFFWRYYRYLILSFGLIPVVGFAIFYFSWPFLWIDSLNRIKEVFFFYKDISDSGLDTRFLILGGVINFYSILWITITTPLIILIFSLVGFLRLLRKPNAVSVELLLLIWFLVPILRVSIIHSFTYGGIRHIMEYIPAMAILSGIGASYLVQNLKFKMQNYLSTLSSRPKGNLKFKIFNFRLQLLTFIFELLIILSFVPITLKLISLYPNESVYFNPLIGGLKGAKDKNIPGWGNTLGSTYRQGIKWINKNAEPNAKLALVFENISNVDRTYLRKDITVRNQFRSGIGRYGEYIIGVTHEGFFKEYYNYKYTQRFLIPQYEVKVDGITLLAVWKNDAAHTKPAYLKQEKETDVEKIEKENNSLIVNFGKKITITRLDLSYDNKNCVFPTNGIMQIYRNGNWVSQVGTLSDFPKPFWFNPQPKIGLFSYPFAGDVVDSIKIISDNPESCFVKNSLKGKVWYVK